MKSTILVLKSGYTVKTPGHVAEEVFECLSKGFADKQEGVLTFGGSFILYSEVAAVLEEGE